MSATSLYLMRHGTPLGAGRLIGRTDADVTDEGIAACVAQARALETATLICSDLMRARRCAEAIGVPQVDPRWRELDFGAWDGKRPADVEPAALSRFWDDPDTAPPPGGERWSGLVTRVGAAIDALPREPTLVVTHAGAMRAALSHLCGLNQAATWALALPYAAVLALTIWDGEPRRAQVTALWP